MNAGQIYLLDSDVFITAKNYYYAFDICPGFWNGVLAAHQRKRMFSIEGVRRELLFGRKTEDLVKWVRKKVPIDFFINIDEEVGNKYGEIMLWAQRNAQYSDSARAKLATGADGWLVATASVHAAFVVTNEQPAPLSKVSIKLPDVCDAFDVQYKTIFEVLRELDIQFDLVK